jgi:hypothetical protein
MKIKTATKVALSVMSIPLVLVLLAACTPADTSANNAPLTMPTDIPNLSDDKQLTQCRIDAVTAYMTLQEFGSNDYAIGVDNIDTTASELNETGSLAFGKDGANVTTRAELTDVFTSQDEALKSVVQAQVAKMPSIDKTVLLDARNWEVVQVNVAMKIEGNTGINNGEVVPLGARNSAAGDAAWLFVNPDTCTVPFAEVAPPGASPTDPPTVPLIRVGCINPGDNLTPLTPKPPTCPPGQVFNKLGKCVVPKSTDPVDYIAPGEDSIRDAGKDVSPAVPTVTAEPAPPTPVATTQPGGGGVVDNSGSAPGTEAGTTAPGATPAPPTPVVTTPLEPGVTPDDGTPNPVNPVNPFP